MTPRMGSHINEAPKRHIIGRGHVVWAIVRLNQSMCLTCGVVEKTGNPNLPSNTWLYGPTRVYALNHTLVGSAVFAGHTNIADRRTQTHRQTTLYCMLCIRCGLKIRREINITGHSITTQLTRLKNLISVSYLIQKQIQLSSCGITYLLLLLMVKINARIKYLNYYLVVNI